MIVLMVDDSDVNLAVYRGVLSRLPGVEIVSFTSPLAALAWAGGNSPGVVVDYHMPEMGGLEFIKAFREAETGPQALLLMVTSDEEKAVRYRALDAGATDFVLKPIDRIEFTARVRGLLEIAESRREQSDRAESMRTEIARATASLAAREIETIVRLTRAAALRDDVTGKHVIRVGNMCAALARSIGLPDDECRTLRLAAPMHDIGKVATPDAILLKPGPLTPEEFEIMKQHTTAGFEILDGSDSPVLRCAAEIALTHHERFDGKGYPRGLAGSDIPLSGRLCSIVDVFDALTSRRPYKEAWPIDAALTYIDEAIGTQFDPDIGSVFHDALDEIRAIKEEFSDATALKI
jgi:putative two-component system response regulator